MAGVKFGEPFGFDTSSMSDDDWDLAVDRIIQDLKSDFIFAPHISFVFKRARNKLIELVHKKLKSGDFLPGIPVTIDVPKASRIKVASTPTRLGPNFTRPGSILLPMDRLVYQILSDRAVSIVDSKSDSERSFSHQIDKLEPSKLFKSTRICWSEFQAKLQEYAALPSIRYVLKLDVANFFGSINQHTLVNVLQDAGYPKPYVDRLEVILTAFTGDRSSRGILQGIFPSDLLGNFYLEPIDRFLGDMEIPSARYVDDIFIFVKSIDEAEFILRSIQPELRVYDLGINEAKSVIIPKNALNTEEPDLDALFQDAISEISDQIDEEDFDTDYGFQSDWDEEILGEDEDEDEDEGYDLELHATENLFDSVSEYSGHEESIERFCLPLFSKAGSDYAVQHSIDSFKKRPSMTQIYCTYLVKFIHQDEVYSFLKQLINDVTLHDWQRMWVLVALLYREPKSDVTTKDALKILRDGKNHEALRAVAAIYIGVHGDAIRRKTLQNEYAHLTPYVQSAIFFSSMSWPAVERNKAKASWGNQGEINPMIKAAMENKG